MWTRFEGSKLSFKYRLFNDRFSIRRRPTLAWCGDDNGWQQCPQNKQSIYIQCQQQKEPRNSTEMNAEREQKKTVAQKKTHSLIIITSVRTALRFLRPSTELDGRECWEVATIRRWTVGMCRMDGKVLIEFPSANPLHCANQHDPTGWMEARWWTAERKTHVTGRRTTWPVAT